MDVINSSSLGKLLQKMVTDASKDAAKAQNKIHRPNPNQNPNSPRQQRPTKPPRTTPKDKTTPKETTPKDKTKTKTKTKDKNTSSVKGKAGRNANRPTAGKDGKKVSFKKVTKKRTGGGNPGGPRKRGRGETSS